MLNAILSLIDYASLAFGPCNSSRGVPIGNEFRSRFPSLIKWGFCMRARLDFQAVTSSLSGALLMLQYLSSSDSFASPLLKKDEIILLIPSPASVELVVRANSGTNSNCNCEQRLLTLLVHI